MIRLKLIKKKGFFPVRCLASLLGLALFLSGCSATVLNRARDEFYSGSGDKAVETLSGAKYFSRKSKLLLYMEKGAILHHLGKYEESVTELLNASQLMDEQDVVSISQQATSMVTSDKAIEYKGEYSERLWVHTYLMMNFLLLRKYESALVEAKQALKVFDAHPESLAGDHFTRALIALCYDNVREYNDAYIEYKKLAELLPSPEPVGADLYRLAVRLRFEDDAKLYKKYVDPKRPPSIHQPQTEAIVFFSMGMGPVKIPTDIVLPKSFRFSFPRYVVRSSPEIVIRVNNDNNELAFNEISSDINELSKKSLDERKVQIIAKETARVAAKEAIAQQVGEKNGALAESLVRVTFFLLEEADIRGWQTLPALLALIRIPLEPGEHSLKIMVEKNDAGTIQEIVLPEFAIDKGQRRYFSVRQ